MGKNKSKKTSKPTVKKDDAVVRDADNTAATAPAANASSTAVPTTQDSAVVPVASRPEDQPGDSEAGDAAPVNGHKTDGPRPPFVNGSLPSELPSDKTPESRPGDSKPNESERDESAHDQSARESKQNESAPANHALTSDNIGPTANETASNKSASHESSSNQSSHGESPPSESGSREASPRETTPSKAASSESTPPGTKEPPTSDVANMQLDSAQTPDGEGLAELRAQLEQAETERDEIQEEYDNLLEKVTLIKQKLGERFKVLEAEAAAAKQEAETAKQEQEAARRDSEAARRETEAARQETKAARLETAELSQQLATARADAGRLAAEADSHKQTAAALKAQLVSQKIMFDQEVLNERLAKETLEVEVAQLHSSLGDTEAVALQSARTNDAQEQEIVRLKAELAAAQRQEQSAVHHQQAQLDAVAHERDLARQELAAVRPRLDELLLSSQQAGEAQAKLQLEAKENQLLIGKLRHEAVILNDHLTQALRMIRKDSEGSSVDKELVSNLFVQYATCPRQDTKKFEILQLIANFLDWDEPRRQHVGLVKTDDAELADLPPTQMVGFVGRLAEYLESKRK